MNWVQLFGAVGVGAIATKLLDVFWLQNVIQQNERRRWLREQRLKVYSALAKYLLRAQVGPNRNDNGQGLELVAEFVLIAPSKHLASLVQNHLRDLHDTNKQLGQIQGAGTDAPGGLGKMIADEKERIETGARELVELMRESLANDD